MIYWIIALGVISFIFLLKIIVMKKSMKEISSQFENILNEDTNALICISSGDKDIKKFAADINKNLKDLREKSIYVKKENSRLTNSITAISHDLRTPLTAMIGYIDLLEREEKSELAESYTLMIKNRAYALRNLTEEFFGYSVVFSGEHKQNPEKISLNAVLEESIAVFYAVIEKSGINPKINIPDENIVLNLDKNYVMRIFSNIISNAVRYGGGDLNITLDTSAKIIFSNSAPNLDNVTAARLFDRFYTVENARGSTGLGLTIAKELAEQMNGKIYSDFEDKILTITVDFSELL